MSHGGQPAGYAEIERALTRLEQGCGPCWMANGLRGVEHPAAIEAAELLRQGRRQAAYKRLTAALWRMAGPSNGNGLEWFVPPRFNEAGAG